MKSGNLNSEIVRLQRGLALPFTAAENERQAIRDLRTPRDGTAGDGQAPSPESPVEGAPETAPL